METGEFIKAGPNKRLTAYLFDSLFAGMAGGLLSHFIGNIWGLAVAYLYMLLKDARGASIGKLIVGIRVVDANNATLQVKQGILRNLYLAGSSFASIFSRWMGYLSLAVIMVEYYLMMTNVDGRRLGDLSFGTRVHDVKPHLKDGLFLIISLVLMACCVFIFLRSNIKYVPQG